MKLYELSNKYNELIAYMEETDQLDELKDTLDSIEYAFDSKVESIAKLIKAKDAERQAIEDEIKRLKARADKIGKETDWLTNYIQTEMEHTGRDKVKSALFNISLNLNPPAVNVIDESVIPSKLFTVKVTRNLDKRGIMERLKNGEKIPGVELIQRKHLKIG